MGKFVQPKVFHVGYTQPFVEGLRDYLKYTGQDDFWASAMQARDEGLSWGEIMCSMFAKMCYKSLVLGKNANVKRVRDVQKNLESCFDAGHGSIFEHFGLNFIITDCSRVFTHELVRHRVGTAFSQTSGRYCRLDSIDMVWDPILDPARDIFVRCIGEIEMAVYLAECRLGLRRPKKLEEKMVDPDVGEATLNWDFKGNYYGWPDQNEMWVPDDSFDFEKRKKITSAIRRIAPNGQSNEIAFSVNVRALRQLVQIRTARFAEWEIRAVFAQIYHLISAEYPTMFYKAKTRMYDELPEVYGMKTQPFEIEAGDPKALQFYETPLLEIELKQRADRGFTQTESPK